MNRYSRLFGLSLVLVLLLALVGGVGAQDEPVVIFTSVDMVGGDIPTLDPSQAETSASIAVMNFLFPGLSYQDELTSEFGAGAAESWEVSEDGLTYTFTIQEDLPWVQYNPDTGEVEQVLDENGEPRVVTAQDFAYGIERSLNPETASPYSYIIVPFLNGAADFNSGEVDASALGVEVIDDRTIAISGPEAASFTISIYGLWITFAQPSWAIEEAGDLWTEPEFINTYGPFALKEWNHDEDLTLITNPFWPGTEVLPVPQVDEVVFRFLDPQTQLAEYEAGTLDAIEPPLEELDRIRADATLSQELSIATNPCTYYLGFDNTEYPMDNANLRRALSQAIDRESIVTNVTKGGQIPAQWFARPGLNAALTLESHPDVGIFFDVEAAQADLAVALEELGLASVDELPQITLSYNDSSGHAAIMQAIQQMWSDTLGIQVQLAALEPSTYFSNVSEDAPMIYRSGWCQDYSDASNFLFDVFFSESSQNDPGFNNARYDELVLEARALSDVETRRELYAEAEEILVDEVAAIAPIYWYTSVQMTRPNVERTFAITGTENYTRWNVTR